MQVVPIIIKIQQHFNYLSRNSMFLAIAIFDLYLKNLTLANQHYLWTSQDNHALALASFLLAWKFQGDSYPSFKSISKTLSTDQSTQQFKSHVIKFQQDILNRIDFDIPTTTAYDVLDSIVSNDQLTNDETSKFVAFTIKIMLTAVLLTCQLSFDPSLGRKIHEIITKKNSKFDPKAKSIFRKCLQTLQHQQQTQKQIQIPAN